MPGPRAQRIRRIKLTDNQHPAPASDRGLLGGDHPEVRAQPLGMIKRNTGEDGAVCVPQVGGIQPTTKTYLQHNGIATCLLKTDHGGERGCLKVGQRVGCYMRCHLVQSRQDLFISGVHSIDADTLVEADEVR